MTSISKQAANSCSNRLKLWCDSSDFYVVAMVRLHARRIGRRTLAKLTWMISAKGQWHLGSKPYQNQGSKPSNVLFSFFVNNECSCLSDDICALDNSKISFDGKSPLWERVRNDWILHYLYLWVNHSFMRKTSTILLLRYFKLLVHN